MKNLSQELLTQAENLILAYVAEKYPGIETRVGTPFRELIIAPAAIGYAFINKHLEDFKRSFSLASIPGSEDILLDWIPRQREGKANGILEIELSAEIESTLPQGSQFITKDGLVFVTTTLYHIRGPFAGGPGMLSITAPEHNILQWHIIDASARRIFLYLPVEAIEKGGIYNIPKDTEIVRHPLRAVIRIKAHTNFLGGTEEDLEVRPPQLYTRDGIEINEDIIEKLLTNWFVKRKQGNKATGTLRIRVSRDRIYTVPANTVFTTKDGLNFATTKTFVISSAHQVNLEEGTINLVGDVATLTKTFAQGILEIGVLRAGTFTIPIETNFVDASGRRFKTTRAYTVSNAFPTNLEDGKIGMARKGWAPSLNEPTFFFLLPVTAEKEGDDYILPRGTVLQLLPGTAPAWPATMLVPDPPPWAPNIPKIRGAILARSIEHLPFSPAIKNWWRGIIGTTFDAIMAHPPFPICAHLPLILGQVRYFLIYIVHQHYWTQEQFDKFLAIVAQIFAEECTPTVVEISSFQIITHSIFKRPSPEFREWFFLLPIEAEQVGKIYCIAQDTVFTFSLFDDIINAVAYRPFDGGEDKEDVLALLNRAKTSITMRSLVSRRSIKAAILEKFPTTQQVNVIGFGDREMSRDKNMIYGFGGGGKVDVYVRTNSLPNSQDVSLTWEGNQIIIPPTLNPLYRIERIVRDRGGVPFPSFTALYGLAPTKFHELRESPIHGRFTTYERTRVALPISSLTPRDVILQIINTPLIQEIQKFFLEDPQHVVCADILIKAVIPCFVRGTIRFQGKIDMPKTKEEMLDLVNSWPIGTPLSASSILGVLYKAGATKVLMPISIRGLLCLPDGREISLIMSDDMKIPTDYAMNLSQNTSAYFLFPEILKLEQI